MRMPSALLPSGVVTRELTELPGAVWPSTECKQSGDPAPMSSVLREVRRVEARDVWQPHKAIVWSAAILHGGIGVDGLRDPGHLHDSYIEPSLVPSHLDAVIEPLLEKVQELELDVLLYHDNPVASAMVGRIRAVFAKPNLRAVPVSRAANGQWSFPADLVGNGERAAVVDDGMNQGNTIVALVHGLRTRNFKVVAAIILEDKLDDLGDYTVQAVCSVEEIELLSLHRSPPISRVTEANCPGCRVQDAARVMNVPNAGRPAFATQAYQALSTHVVWRSAARSRRDRSRATDLLELEESCDVVDGFNALLRHQQEIAAAPRAMDTMVRDALFEGGARHVHDTVTRLDAAWRERALLWLTTAEYQQLGEDLPDDASALSVALGRLKHSATISQFSAELERSQPTSRRIHQQASDDTWISSSIYCLRRFFVRRPWSGCWLRNVPFAPRLKARFGHSRLTLQRSAELSHNGRSRRRPTCVLYRGPPGRRLPIRRTTTCVGMVATAGASTCSGSRTSDRQGRGTRRRAARGCAAPRLRCCDGPARLHTGSNCVLRGADQPVSYAVQAVL